MIMCCPLRSASGQKFEKSTNSTNLVSLSDNLGFGTDGCLLYLLYIALN